MKTYTLNEIQDEFIGVIGTPKRDKFEAELQKTLQEKAGIQIQQESLMNSKQNSINRTVQ